MSADATLSRRARILRKLMACPEDREPTAKGQVGGEEQPVPCTSVASIGDAVSREWAAHLVTEGACVAAFVRSVWVLWLDPANRDAVATIYRIKGERRIGRPMGTTLPAASVVDMLDPARIAPDLRKIVLDPVELESRLGMLCLIRVPIKRSAVEMLPPDLVSHAADGTNWLQTCVITGSAPVVALIQTMQNLGVAYPAVTSMNVSGQPEIVEQDEAEAFCRARAIPLALADPEGMPLVRGSFPIIEVGAAGARLLRAGHFPSYLFRYLLDGADVALAGATPAKFPLVCTHHEEAATRTNASQLREEIIARLEGRDRVRADAL